MCLAVPGEIVSISADDDPLVRTAVVRFGPVTRSVSLAVLPEAGVGDWVLVHTGIAISRVDPARADAVFRWLEEAVDKADAHDKATAVVNNVATRGEPA